MITSWDVLSKTLPFYFLEGHHGGSAGLIHTRVGLSLCGVGLGCTSFYAIVQG